MASKKRSVEEIIGKLREAEVALAQQGETVRTRDMLRFFSVNHGPALGPAGGNPKLRDKKSVPGLSCPICW